MTATDPAPNARPARLHATRPTMRLATPRTVAALILREMSTTYGRSPGGYVWLILEPILGIALLSAVFSLGFRNPRLGTNFPMFYATGMLPFLCYMDVSTRVSQAINYSRQLLNYPRVTFVDTLLARFALGALTQLLVALVILTGIRAIWDTRTIVAMDQIVLAYAMVLAIAAGVGILNCFLVTSFPVWQRVWSIVNRPLFFLSGIILLLESVPEPYRSVLWFNPLIHPVGEMRAAFYLEYEATYVSPAYVFGVSLTMAVIGLLFLRQYHRDIMER